MINLNANRITKILGLYGFDSINECTRECVREHYGYENDFIESVASEYAKNFKQMALDDFSMESGLDVEESSLFNYGDCISIKPDGICSDGNIIHAVCSYKDRDIEEFESCELSRKIMIYAQYSMLAANTKKCHVIQWNSKTSKIETVKFNKKFIDQTKPIIDDFIYNTIETIETDSDRHLTNIDNSSKAKIAAEKYIKAQQNLTSAINKLNEATEKLNSFCVEEKINVAGLLLIKTNEGIKIK